MRLSSLVGSAVLGLRALAAGARENFAKRRGLVTALLVAGCLGVLAAPAMADDPAFPAITLPWAIASIGAAFATLAVAILAVVFPFRVGLRIVWRMVSVMGRSIMGR